MSGRPLIRNSLKNILYPNLSATAIASRFALAPINVPLPPRSAPNASAYHNGL